MIIADTNFIINCVKRKIDFSKIDELVVPCEVIGELEKIEQAGSYKDRNAAKIALGIIKKSRIKKIKLNDKVDRGIVKLAEKQRVTVATFDRELKKKLMGKARIFDVRD